MFGNFKLVFLGVFLTALPRIQCVNYTSSGASGVQCGEFKCLTGDRASCVDGQCVCSNRRFRNGDGRISCHSTNEIFTGVFNDPVVTTANGNHANLPIFCRYQFTYYESQLMGRGRENIIGKCNSVVNIWHEKDLGKSYVGGMDIAVNIKYFDSTPTFKFSMRITGSAHFGAYTYQVLGTLGSFLVDGPYGEDVIKYFDLTNKVKLKVKYDSDNNIVMFGVKKCGFRVKFRAYDSGERRNQTQMPGAVVGINEAFAPRYRKRTDSIAMVPMSNPEGFTIDDILLKGLGRGETMTYRALMSETSQVQPEPNEQCAMSKALLDACDTDDKLMEAFNNCYWMLKSPRFIKRFDPSVSGEAIMGLFNKCISVFCGGTDCSQVISTIKNSAAANVTGYYELDQFQSGSMCP